jgi:CRP-like cAMP-binding protein
MHPRPSVGTVLRAFAPDDPSSARYDQPVQRDTVARAAFLAHLDPGERDRVLAAGSEQALARGQLLFVEGEPAEAVFVLVAGRMKLVRYSEKGRELLIHLVAPGQSFAEAALFGAGTYPATAEAVEDSRVWRLPREGLLRLVRADPELGLAMMASIAVWTRRLVGKLQLLTQRRVEERLAVYLLSRAAGREHTPGEVERRSTSSPPSAAPRPRSCRAPSASSRRRASSRSARRP